MEVDRTECCNPEQQIFVISDYHFQDVVLLGNRRLKNIISTLVL